MPPRLLPLLHVIPPIWASLTDLMPEFRLGLAIDHRATGHPGQKFRHLRADTGNTRQCPAKPGRISANARATRRLIPLSASIDG
ncbi:MAG: hypothetical protein PHT60_15725 [Acidiphilium sp.]|nr:hypothetical protein [Acidiphilium sp.]MDD4937212.1 hypothetical protein [Acidiphilium sp.]